jgi:hypothetical protein
MVLTVIALMGFMMSTERRSGKSYLIDDNAFGIRSEIREVIHMGRDLGIHTTRQQYNYKLQ